MRSLIQAPHFFGDEMDKFSVEWWNAIEQAKSLCILTHKDPDGDGLSAALALQLVLKAMQKDAKIVIADDIPAMMWYLNVEEHVTKYDSSLSYHTILVLDCHDLKRLGICAGLISSAERVLVLDHHHPKDVIPNAMAYIDESAVCVGILLHSLLKSKIPLLTVAQKKYYATCLYTTLLNDTDNFINSNTDSSAFLFAADLQAMGIAVSVVAENFLYHKTSDELRFVGQTLSTIQTAIKDRVLFMHSSLAMLQTNHLTQDATTKLTRWVKGCVGIEVIVYLREIEPNVYRLSLRSPKYDMNAVAVSYGGGGHRAAAGCTINGSLNEVVQLVTNRLYDIIQ